MDRDALKREVAAYWDQEACGTNLATSQKYSREYFDEIEVHRYRLVPEIFSFAQFTRFHGQRVLEVGVGAGTDFIQWVRAGAEAYGVDLTQEAVDHVMNRLDVYGLQAADVRVADAEALPYPDGKFHLVYSCGVIHHSPDMVKALSEIIRCTKPGGKIKLMIYHRHSLTALYYYLRYGLLRGRPFRSFADVIYHHMESLGTKAYTVREIREILKSFPVRVEQVQTDVTYYDLRPDKPLLHAVARLLAIVCGPSKCGWFMWLDLQKQPGPSGAG